MNTRLAVARALLFTQQGQSLSRVIPEFLPQIPDKDRALFQEMLYGVLRWQLRLDYFLQQLLQKPIKPKDQDIAMLILVGLYQLAFMRIKPHAAVNETVNAAKKAMISSWTC